MRVDSNMAKLMGRGTRMVAVIESAILAAIEARLDRALALPPIRYRRFVAGNVHLGEVDDDRAARLRDFGPNLFQVDGEKVVLADRLNDARSRSAALADVALTLRAEGALPAWRDELYAVATEFGMPAVLHLERGAARYFGVRTWAAHVNGLVASGDSTRMWLARRSPTKAVDPDLLDNLVGGGIAAGLSVGETVIKEAWEEAGIDETMARSASLTGTVHVLRPMLDGLQRETIFVHDLWLPEDFIPDNRDGEAVEHRLVSLEEAARTIARDDGPDQVTVDATLVVLDCLVRLGAIRTDVGPCSVKVTPT
jgi:8-oxo-dGTP pyrophosphatase MutT (NUDIX family)